MEAIPLLSFSSQEVARGSLMHFAGLFFF